MKVLLCCAGGLSSSILMKKMKTWADAHGEDLEIQAMGTGEAVETWQNGYECVLLAPQVSYRLKQLQEEIKLPRSPVRAKMPAYRSMRWRRISAGTR